MDAGFVLALPFHHGDLEPDCVEVSTGWAFVRGIKIPPQVSTKNAGGVYAQGGGIVARQLRDSTSLHT